MILPNSYVVKVTHDLINTANREVRTGYITSCLEIRNLLWKEVVFTTLIQGLLYIQKKENLKRFLFSDIEESNKTMYKQPVMVGLE